MEYTKQFLSQIKKPKKCNARQKSEINIKAVQSNKNKKVKKEKT